MLVLIVLVYCVSQSRSAPLENSTIMDSMDNIDNNLMTRCLHDKDPWACVGIILRDIDHRKQMRPEVEQVVPGEYDLQTHLADNDWENNEITSTSPRQLNLRLETRRMVLPLLIGIVLKKLGFIPLVLGKLVFLGTIAILASKLSLFLSALMIIKKMFGDHGGISSMSDYLSHGQHGASHFGHSMPSHGMYHGGHHGVYQQDVGVAQSAPQESYGHGSGGHSHAGIHPPVRRRTYIVRSRGRNQDRNDFQQHLLGKTTNENIEPTETFEDENELEDQDQQ